ncbi:MAG: hypothetical protein PVJ73_02955 [Acidobacteriota bacterium]|nr:hypothetical protein [Acidobacteriota bacterium]
MSARGVALAVALLALGIPRLAAAQGLGETAAQERARRESQAKAKEETPVYTNNDLDAIRPPEAESDDEDGGDEGASASNTSPRREESRPRPSGRVRGRDDPDRNRRDEVSRAQARVDQIEARIRELNGRLNPMSRDYIYGDASNVDAANEELRIRQELNDLEQELRQARQDLSDVSAGRSGGGVQPEPDLEPVGRVED